MYSALAKHILYPIGERLLGTTLLKYFKELEETQWRSPQQLRELQNEKLRALIKHAYENVPYYHRIFEERGLTDKDIQTIEDLPKLPVLTKDDIRQNFQDLMAKDFKKWKPFLNATSGSTGEPLRYYVTMDTASINWAGAFRGWGWAGYKLGDKRAMLGGFSALQRPSLRDRVRWLLERTLPLPSVKMDRDKIKLYIDKMRRFKPRFLYGSATAVYLMADYLKKWRISDIQPKAIFTTAEMLLPYYRQTIEERFGCKVFDQYGCYDGGPQALECPTHQGYHISAEKVVMEFVSEDRKPVFPGCSGEILATDLHNYAMPFIRYAVGDIGTLAKGECPCGRGLPLMKSIEGRVTDFVVLKSGDRIPGLSLVDIFEPIEGEKGEIREYQIVQESVNRMCIKIVKGFNYTSEDTLRILDRAKKYVGEDMEIEVEFVDEIPPTEAGKYRFIISNLQR